MKSPTGVRDSHTTGSDDGWKRAGRAGSAQRGPEVPDHRRGVPRRSLPSPARGCNPGCVRSLTDCARDDRVNRCLRCRRHARRDRRVHRGRPQPRAHSIELQSRGGQNPPRQRQGSLGGRTGRGCRRRDLRAGRRCGAKRVDRHRPAPRCGWHRRGVGIRHPYLRSSRLECRLRLRGVRGRPHLGR